MPRLKTYDLFISHAWRDDDDYNRLLICCWRHRFSNGVTIAYRNIILSTQAVPRFSVKRLTARSAL